MPGRRLLVSSLMKFVYRKTGIGIFCSMFFTVVYLMVLFKPESYVLEVQPLRVRKFLQTINSENTTCTWSPEHLHGHEPLDRGLLSIQELENKYSYMINGHYTPSECRPVQKVAIIIPYRDRERGLLTFLNNVIPRIHRQNVEFGIYLVEQVPGGFFNKGTCFNAGFQQAMADYNYDCIVLHDVDILPEDDRNLYTCGYYPKHQAVLVEQFNYSMPYLEFVGGIITMTPGRFKQVNGFSNLYMDWGLEDDDIHRRITVANNMTIERPPSNVALCGSIEHSRPNNMTRLNDRCYIFTNNARGWRHDGLNSARYNVVKKQSKKLFNWIVISFNTMQMRREFKAKMENIMYLRLPPVAFYSGTTEMCYYALKNANKTIDPYVEDLMANAAKTTNNIRLD